jgi:hypothetical protein
LLEVAVKDSPFTISSTKRVAIPVGEATIIEATDRYKLAVTPTQIDESGRVRLEIWVRDVMDSRRIKTFIAPNFGTPVRIVRGSPGEQSIEIVTWSR